MPRRCWTSCSPPCLNPTTAYRKASRREASGQVGPSSCSIRLAGPDGGAPGVWRTSSHRGPSSNTSCSWCRASSNSAPGSTVASCRTSPSPMWGIAVISSRPPCGRGLVICGRGTGPSSSTGATIEARSNSPRRSPLPNPVTWGPFWPSRILRPSVRRACPPSPRGCGRWLRALPTSPPTSPSRPRGSPGSPSRRCCPSTCASCAAGYASTASARWRSRNAGWTSTP